MADTTIGLSNDVKSRLEPIKNASEAQSWDDFMDQLIEERIGVAPEDLDEHTVEHHERVEETRATVVGVLEAVDEADMVDEVVEIITALSQQDMLAQNQEIVSHLMEKAEKGGEINEADRLLARMVMETEGSRDQESPAAAIARGLFGEETKAERSTTESKPKPDAKVDDAVGEIVLDQPENDE